MPAPTKIGMVNALTSTVLLGWQFPATLDSFKCDGRHCIETFGQ